MLNLNALTRVLKSWYVDAQKAVHPVMLKIKTFSRAYVVHIKRVAKAQQEYDAAGDDIEKQNIALTSAEEQIENAIIRSGLLNEVLGDNKEEVNAMARQLGLVRDDLVNQLQILQDRLLGLQRTLKAQQEAMSELKAAFWGAVAGAFGKFQPLFR
jgi:chromosome segregation ATPase